MIITENVMNMLEDPLIDLEAIIKAFRIWMLWSLLLR